MKQVVSLTVVGLVLVLALPTPAEQEETGIVNGVVERDGQPVESCHVVVTCAARSDYEEETTTDADGRFQFANVLVGQFTIYAFDESDILISRGDDEITTDGETVEVVMNEVE